MCRLSARLRPVGLATVALVLAATSAHGQGRPTPTFNREATVHDPSIVRDGSTFYVFGSHLASASSTDMMNWTQISTSPTAGNALVPNPAAEFAEALAWASTDTFWAPDVIRLGDGRYYFYYNACKGDSPRSAMGIAVADTITGPYKNAGLILKSGMWGEVSPDGRVYDATVHPNVVDPSVFFDRDGQLWMVYGSYSGGIFILRLDPDTGVPLPGQGYGRHLMGGNHARIEAPYILYSPDTEYYYLFVSYGGLGANDGYNVRIGRSRQPDGPFVDANGTDLATVRGAPGTLFDDASIAPHGVKIIGNYQFLAQPGEPQTTSRGYRSPGHNSAYYDPATGKYFLVFHTRFVGRGEQHEVRVHQMFVTADGWLAVAPHRYAGETAGPLLATQLAGSYKFINHGKAISPQVNTSVAIQLHGDGRITGPVAGEWSVIGENQLRAKVAGVEFDGVFLRQWDDDQRTWVYAFTALTPDGTAVWGSQVAAAAANVAPTILRQPSGITLFPNQPLRLSVVAQAHPEPAYQWRRNGTDIPGATEAVYFVPQSDLSRTGEYSVVIRNAVGEVTSQSVDVAPLPRPAQLTVPSGSGAARIRNLSTRGIVASGENALIAGFVLSGPGTKTLLILSAGQNLVQYGVNGTIGRPRLTLYRQGPDGAEPLASNQAWEENAATIEPLAASLGAQRFAVSADPGRGDAGLVTTLGAGAYSVVVVPADTSWNSDGVGMVEIFDASPDSAVELRNISSRGRVEAGERQMIVGLVIGGTGEMRTLIRGVGPALQPLGVNGVLRDPRQTVYRSTNEGPQYLAENDDWWNSAQADQSQVLFNSVGAFALPAYGADSVVLVRLPAGGYSSIISPPEGEAGVAIAEIYDANGP